MGPKPLDCSVLNEGLLREVREQWIAEVEKIRGDTEDFRAIYLEHAEILIKNPEGNSQIFGLFDENKVCKAIFHAHAKPIKGHPGVTMRVPWIQQSPNFDLGQWNHTELADFSAGLMVSAIELSLNELKADRIKMHLSNVVDREFVSAWAFVYNGKQKDFTVEIVGGWLHIEYVN
ncbi:hypothetical protein RYZ26_07615 [Terasakiella sp. A23]|uniref:hypothetical protein n=1 Tax=Terasakiella sp. FCG-A23 TaxID=3080561 RepID=UPI002954A8EB|nr:hypothetical protein [Terasakiella sp. A23]MDV7339454.1 hypothetical protein [Terasakiella sp. A23]